MQIQMNTLLSKIIDVSAYSSLKAVTKPKYHAKLRKALEDETADQITSAIRHIFNRRIPCSEFQLKSPAYKTYGRYHIQFKVELSLEDIQNMISEYIVNQLGEDKLAEINLELNDLMYSIIEDNKWLK